MTQRKSFVFPDDVQQRLSRLTKSTRLGSNSAVVRLALLVFEDLVSATSRGDKIFIHNETGDAKAYSPFLGHAK